MDGKKILIIKDDPEFVASAKQELESRGFDVIVTDKRPGAATIAAEEQPDLIILGLVMDDLSAGCSILSKLQFDDETRDIPVIMVSAVTTKRGFRIDENGKPNWLNAEEFLNMPVDFEYLANRVCEIISNGECVRD